MYTLRKLFNLNESQYLYPYIHWAYYYVTNYTVRDLTMSCLSLHVATYELLILSEHLFQTTLSAARQSNTNTTPF